MVQYFIVFLIFLDMLIEIRKLNRLVFYKDFNFMYFQFLCMINNLEEVLMIILMLDYGRKTCYTICKIIWKGVILLKGKIDFFVL